MPPSPKDGGLKGNAPKGDWVKGPNPIWGPPLAKNDSTTATVDKLPHQPMQVVEGPSLAPPKGAESPATKPDPVKEPPVVKPTDKEPAKSLAKLSPALIATLRKRVQAACPTVTGVKIEVAMNKLRIELTVRNEDQITPSAEKVFAVPELADYREQLELAFTVAP